MSGECLKGAWGCLRDVVDWCVSGGCLEGVWGVSGRVSGDDWRVSQGCIKEGIWGLLSILVYTANHSNAANPSNPANPCQSF